jgi:hypothetical protein
MAEQPMTDAERELLEQRWAARVNVPSEVMHAARTARWAVDHAVYARLDAPAVVVRAVEALEGWAISVQQRVAAEREELERRGVEIARFQRDLERGTLSPPPDQGSQP